jgi:S1-C subfamily serine protease
LLYRIYGKLGFVVVLTGICVLSAHAQVAAPKLPPPPEPDTLKVETSTRARAPQVVTIVHRLNGVKALALLRRSGEKVVTVDDKLVTSAAAVTNITAGFLLGDGQSIAARLSQAEIDAVMTPPGASTMSYGYRTGVTTQEPKVWTNRTPAAPRADFVVVESSGKQFAARYIGMDGGSGLSLLKINGTKTQSTRDAREETLSVGQRVRLYAPVRVAFGPAASPDTISVRLGEMQGKVTDITRTSAGKIAYLTVSAQNLSPAIVGGIALNDAGETIGIVETSDDGKARLIPAATVRSAATRVLARQASVPRPWLGVRGEAVAATSLETFYSIGWTQREAAKLKESYSGILLTSVAPGTPAALADLRAGDVIVRVNDCDVKSAEDFSSYLNEAGGGATVNFTFFRGQTPRASAAAPAPRPPLAAAPPLAPAPPARQSPDAFAQLKPLEVSVKMGEALNAARAMHLAEGQVWGGFAMPRQFPSIARGLETVPLSVKAAAQMGARPGLLVVFVDPESAAARAGLRVFDVIESVEGKPLGRSTLFEALPAGNPQKLLFGIVREQRKITLTLEQKQAQQK